MRGRNTIQKELIKKEIKLFHSFFNAEELYLQVSKKDSKIGVATVYRFLKKLAEDGKIHTYLCDRKTIYSSNIKSHCHFICKKCGDVEHINLKKVDFLQKGVKGDICHFQIDISGICEQCKTK